MSDEDFKARMNYHLSVPLKSSVQDKVREEELLEKCMQNLGKIEVALIVAIILHAVIPKEAIEEQGRGMSSIFKALDSISFKDSNSDRSSDSVQLLSHHKHLCKSSFCKVLQSILNCRNRCNKCILKCIDNIWIRMLTTTQLCHCQWVSILIHGSCRGCSNLCMVDQVCTTLDNLYNLQTHK